MKKIKHRDISKEFIGKLISGDEVAFNELYDLYGGALYGSILKITRDQSLAEDILQVAFVKIWQKLSSFDPEKGSLFNWMYRIVRNTAIDKVRLKYNQVEIQTDDQSVYSISGERVTKIFEEGIGLNTIIEKLDPNEKSVIDLAFFGGFTQVEISRKLKIPLGTVKTRTRSALKQLRKIFN